jgi:hypothetical protein
MKAIKPKTIIFVNVSTEEIYIFTGELDVASMTYDVNLYTIKLDLLGSFLV